MSNAPLVACPSCARHVRLDAPACPFCAVGLTEASLTAVPDAGGRRLSRAAMFAFAATVATAACNTTQRPDASTGSNIVQPYGAPPTPQPTPDAGAPTPQPDLPSMAAIYGAPMPPPPDAATAPAPDAAAPHATPQPAPTPPHHGAPMVRYGAPPPHTEPNAVMARYGAPPPPLDAMC